MFYFLIFGALVFLLIGLKLILDYKKAVSSPQRKIISVLFLGFTSLLFFFSEIIVALLNKYLGTNIQLPTPAEQYILYGIFAITLIIIFWVGLYFDNKLKLKNYVKGKIKAKKKIKIGDKGTFNNENYNRKNFVDGDAETEGDFELGDEN